MFKEVWTVIKEFLSQLFHSRLFPIALFFFVLSVTLIVRLFQLQILEGEEHQQDYIQITQSSISTKATRGNIYDRNGVLLAYDELVYSVTLKDVGYYEKNAQKNQMILELIHLLDECEENVQISIPIRITEEYGKEKYEYSTTSTTRIRQFLRDIYGCSLADLDSEDGKYKSDITAEEAVEIMKKNFYFSTWKDENGEPVSLSKNDELRVVSIRYDLKQHLYKKYMPITIASNVSQETMATVMEHSKELVGVSVDEDYNRVYPDGIYFSQIIGYTGSANSDELAELQAVNPSYESGDVVGKSGIEALLELRLAGTKGSKEVYLDSTGKILSVISEQEPVVGDDVYLTIDHDLTIASYKLLEAEMAGILLQYMTKEESSDEEEGHSYVSIPVVKIYTQLFENHVLDLQKMSDIDASDAEHEIFRLTEEEKDRMLELISRELQGNKSDSLPESTQDELKEAMDLVFDFLCERSGLINTDVLDKKSDEYLSVKKGESSVRDFINYAISTNNLIDLSAYDTDDKYSDYSQIFQFVYESLLTQLDENTDFLKLFCKELIENGTIKPYLICQSLYSQNILEMDETQMNNLEYADDDACYQFIRKCIQNIEITPEQLALDPCNGAVVITDPNDGHLLTLVSYPSYDNNYFSGTVNAAYYKSLLENQANPLFNYATQARSAPGSTFKMVSSIAALEEKIFSRYDKVECLGIFDKVLPAAKCWIYEENNETHGYLNVVEALANSCNYYYYDVGYHLSLNDKGVYDPEIGIDKLAEYAMILGLGDKTGVEVSEYAPQISTEYPVTSAIGQGTNNFTTVGLARYVTTLANRGTVYQLTLLDKIVDADQNVVDECKNESYQIDTISDSTWDAVQDGMYEVTHSGTVSFLYSDLKFDVSGKTGSAQEDLTRPNHAHFVSYAPSNNPEITVTASIRHGYSSGYTAALTAEIYRYYFGYISMESIENGGAISLNTPIGND